MNVRVDERFELSTQRLTLRMLSRRDVTEFSRYRNIESVSQFQDWQLPYTRDLAHDLIDEMDQLVGPTPDCWVQVAIERHEQLVGDIAIWLDGSAELAMIGYTIAPEHQGNSYAVEAAEAVLTYLFGSVGVHRVAATIDPRNMASARVLERCGFEYVGTARASAWSRGAWTDDARFSLLATDWAAWTGRPTAPPEDVRFAEVSADNLDAVCNISIAHSQRRFVRSPAESIADAAHPPIVNGVPLLPWYRAIIADGEVAGFILVARSTVSQPVPHVWRMLVDQRHQRRGIARRAIGELAKLLLATGDTRLTASFVDEPGGPEAFYQALGFVRTGRIDAVTGEVTASAPLEPLANRVA
ncbi:MAG TPA: GNAT family N-acetyltransferase [Ilumatobacter sp.]|nr:GNAT family N-acetyltransferase [Ilumatobacter sp.]